MVCADRRFPRISTRIINNSQKDFFFFPHMLDRMGTKVLLNALILDHIEFLIKRPNQLGVEGRGVLGVVVVVEKRDGLIFIENNSLANHILR